MTLRGAAVAVAGCLAAALAACSSGGVPAATTSTISASVTQTAPSVWSAPDTASNPLAASSAAGTDGTSGASTLPGLTKPCSSAIRAQLAVNTLFTEALQGTGGAVSPATTTASSATTTAPAGITAPRVAAVFDSLEPSIPAALATPLAALRDAAESIVGKPVTDIPAALASAAVTDAMHDFGDYIAACEPAATD